MQPQPPPPDYVQPPIAARCCLCNRDFSYKDPGPDGTHPWYVVNDLGSDFVFCSPRCFGDWISNAQSTIADITKVATEASKTLKVISCMANRAEAERDSPGLVRPGPLPGITTQLKQFEGRVKTSFGAMLLPPNFSWREHQRRVAAAEAAAVPAPRAAMAPMDFIVDVLGQTPAFAQIVIGRMRQQDRKRAVHFPNIYDDDHRRTSLGLVGWLRVTSEFVPFVYSIVQEVQREQGPRYS